MELLPKDAEKREKNKKVNKVILGVFGALLALMFGVAVLAGGSETPNKTQEQGKAAVSNETGTPTPPANPKASESVSPESILIYARTKGDLPAGMTQAQAFNNAEVVCKRLALKHDPKTVRAGVREMHGTKAGDSIYEAATDLLCPQDAL